MHEHRWAVQKFSVTQANITKVPYNELVSYVFEVNQAVTDRFTGFHEIRYNSARCTKSKLYLLHTCFICETAC